jgi:hypothetical protein
VDPSQVTLLRHDRELAAGLHYLFGTQQQPFANDRNEEGSPATASCRRCVYEAAPGS